ncbi:hypothetical protein LCGC14_2270660 [marine sediment metagenome]|uniref:7-cyano-7-deazaguanine synthase n=1 Tax=marine sediment metagenome TaxID=412755 RepID=A0A0F9FS59_9ZZZZ
MAKPKITFLSQTELEAIHNASLEVLEKTGTVVESTEALDVLKNAGASVDYESCQVTIPPELVAEALNRAVFLADWKRVSIERPFIEMSKREIADLGNTYKVPFEETWSCYKGGDMHCGTCGTCTERKEALKGFDPTEYEQKDLL